MPSHPQSAAKATGPEAETVQTTAAPRQAPGWPDGGERIKSAGSPQEENFQLSSVRVNWQLKAILPVGFVLLAGLLLFTLATVSLRDPDRHAVLIVAGAGSGRHLCRVNRRCSPTWFNGPWSNCRRKSAW